ncbi:GGDEF domain-containing protein [Bacillus sp. PS06]|uniref:GGDEF domain-containing protein n=1 Tax=Bacillus sp. PS06 TaxID=2764176 RepID=UPI00177AAE29|nr:GGDEF domain-containing protein [Bacillus sp. PS06]MBD8070880.1 GGDEF domain-containing protein [Bacillus sp. PS06]
MTNLLFFSTGFMLGAIILCIYIFFDRKKARNKKMSDQIKLQKDLEYQITHDYLTGLYNRRYLAKKLDNFDEECNEMIGLIICDLDELKQVNDRLGHKMGDRLIIEAANILRSFSADNVIVARLGGDEFAIVITGQEEWQIEELVDDISNKVIQYNQSNRSVLSVKLSMGYAYSYYSMGMVDELFHLADKNMYKDKNRKKQSLTNNY